MPRDPDAFGPDSCVGHDTANESSSQERDAVLDRWLAHHYRHHRGEVQDCPARGCKAYTEVMTRG